MMATQRWRELVETEHAQSDQKRGETPPPKTIGGLLLKISGLIRTAPTTRW